MNASNDKGGATIKIIANAVRLIEAMPSRGQLTPGEVAEQLGIPRASAYRLVDGLTAIGLLEPVADGRVRLSTRWLQLADSAQAALTEWSDAAGALEQLVGRTGQTAYLSVLMGDEAVCVDWRRGRGVDVLALKPGRSLPLYAGAAGRIMLAYAVDAEHYLTGAPFHRLTPHTLVTADELRADIELTKGRGFVISEQDVTVGINALGMPILRPDGSVAGCMSVGGLAEAFAAGLPRFRDELTDAVEALTQQGARAG